MIEELQARHRWLPVAGIAQDRELADEGFVSPALCKVFTSSTGRVSKTTTLLSWQRHWYWASTPSGEWSEMQCQEKGESQGRSNIETRRKRKVGLQGWREGRAIGLLELNLTPANGRPTLSAEQIMMWWWQLWINLIINDEKSAYNND